MPTTITMAGMANGIKQISSITLRNLGNFKCTQTTVGTIKIKINTMTIAALITDLKIEIPKSCCFGIIFQASNDLPF